MDPAPSRPVARARHARILRELELRGSVRASEVAARLGVAEITIRRDITTLAEGGHLVRVHGGAVPVLGAARPVPARIPVGVVLPGTGSHFPGIARGVDAAAAGQHARAVLATTGYRADVERRQVRRLVDLGVEGLVIAPTLRDRSAADLTAMLAEVPVPVVIVERRLEGSAALAGRDWVGTDHGRGALLALEHLAGAGHDAVGLAWLERTPTAGALREGYGRAVAHLGLRPAPTRPLPKDDDGAEDPAVRALESFLDDCLDQGVGAALVHTDFHASRLVEIALDRGLRVPEDLAVVAYDDEFADLCIVPLTAVSPPGREIGALALRTILDRLRAEDGEPGTPRHVQVLPHLEVRRSTPAGEPSP